MNPNDNNDHENRQYVVENDEIDIGQLIKTIWSGRGLILGVSLGFFLLVGIFFGIRFLGFDVHRTQDIQISFPFNGAEKGQYPNGTSFQLSDIISSQILSIVYEKQKLSDSGVSLEDFTNSIAIQPDAIDREFIDTKYKARLSAKNLSQAEIEELESSYKAELTTASHRSAIISYNYSKYDRIPPQLISKILFDIPDTWANIAVNQHGVLTPPVVDKKALTDVNQLQKEDFLIGTALMRSDINTILSTSGLITSNERLALIRDPISGLSLVGLINRLNKFDTYSLEPLKNIITYDNIYRNRVQTARFIRSRLETLTDNLELINRKISIYLIAYQETLAASRNYGVGLQLPKGTQTEAQLGDAFLGQLLKLGDELSESTFRKYLLEEQIKYKLQAEDLNTEIIKVKRQLAGIKKTNNGSQKATLTHEPYDKAVEEFMSLMDDYDRIIKVIQQHVLTNKGALYESLNSTARVTNFSEIQIKRIIVFALVALIVGGMVGVFIALTRKASTP